MAERVYYALRPRTRWLKWLLYGWLAFSFMQAISRLELLLQIAGMPVYAGSLGGEQFATAMEGFAALFLIACVVAFCFWMYRANANLHSFGVGNIYSPGWAVGNFFIPVASLWLGYRSMRQVWDDSGPPDSDLDRNGWLLPTWWGAWIVTNILANVLWRMEGLFDPTIWAVMQFAAPVVDLVAGAALATIIGKIDVAQQQQEPLSAF